MCPPLLRVGSELRRAGEDPVYSDQALYKCTLSGAGWAGEQTSRLRIYRCFRGEELS